MRTAPTLPERAAAAERTIARFADQPFAWGTCDCLRMAAAHLRELGHAPPLRDAGQYRTLIGAHRALRRTGFARLDGWVDSWGLSRIAPACRLPGDLLAIQSEVPSMPALAISLPQGRVFCFVPQLDAAAAIDLQPGVAPLAAWSV